MTTHAHTVFPAFPPCLAQAPTRSFARAIAAICFCRRAARLLAAAALALAPAARMRIRFAGPSRRFAFTPRRSLARRGRLGAGTAARMRIRFAGPSRRFAFTPRRPLARRGRLGAGTAARMRIRFAGHRGDLPFTPRRSLARRGAALALAPLLACAFDLQGHRGDLLYAAPLALLAAAALALAPAARMRIRFAGPSRRFGFYAAPLAARRGRLGAGTAGSHAHSIAGHRGARGLAPENTLPAFAARCRSASARWSSIPRSPRTAWWW